MAPPRGGFVPDGPPEESSHGHQHARAGAFPSPYSIETPAGCEGWEEMYPYYALFDERRRDSDENRFWFWNSMHFPIPMPAFDVICIDSPYQAVGAWQNRVFAVPPAMGIDYRIVNGYVYISGNPVTDPDQDRRARRLLPEARRALLRQLGRAVRQVEGRRCEALIAELDDARGPAASRSTSPTRSHFGEDRNTALLRAARTPTAACCGSGT